VSVADRVARILACSAIDGQLSGLLFLDLDPALIYPLANWLELILADGTPVIPIVAGAAEENLWDSITLDRRRLEQPEDLGFRWAPGPLVRDAPSDGGIMVVPDLARAGLPVSRAAVTLVGAEVAHLERSGVAKTWHPQDRWLAALRRPDVGRVSAHLLDRFSVRVDAARLRLPRRGGPVLPDPPQAWTRAIRAVQAGAELPAFSADAADRVLATMPMRSPGARRDLALARLARALAALDRELQALPRHVDEAAMLVGLPGQPDFARPPGLNGEAADGSVNGNTVNGPAANGPAARANEWAVPRTNEWAAQESEHDNGASNAAKNGANGHASVAAGGDPKRLTPEASDDVFAGAASLDGDLYPEDIAKPGPDLAPLRLGWQRAVIGPPRGAPIGTQRAVDTRDIAVAATLLNAARFQRRRCHSHHSEGHPLHVRPADLRSYRRAARPAALLVLVIDHSCREEGWDCYPSLAPYLRWAYVNRALVGVVELGSRSGDVAHELRATQFRSRGALDPRIARALGSRPRGRATPLAHALTLAADLLRHDTQQAGAAVSEAYLVVITDGRANVPLAASLSAQLPLTVVGDGAVKDARDVAGKIGTLRRVRSVVIDQGPRPNAHLTVMLAKALGGQLVHANPAESGGDP
jgi:magnesium chelatase subunit D